MGSLNVSKRKLDDVIILLNDAYASLMDCWVKFCYTIKTTIGAMNLIVCSFYGYLAPQHSSFNARIIARFQR